MTEDRTNVDAPADPPPDLPPPPMALSAATPPAVIVLRTIAIVGTLTALAVQAGDLTHMKPRQGYGIAIFIPVAVLVGIVLLTMLPRAVGRIVRHPDLLLPLGLYVSADFGLATLTRIPSVAAFLNPSWDFNVLSIGYSLSLHFALQMFLTVVYTGWTTTLVWQAVIFNYVEPLKALAKFGHWFWRTILVTLIGWGVILLGSGILLTVGIATGTPVFYFILFLLAVFSLVWSFFTCGLLLTSLHPERRSDLGLTAGFAASQRALSRSWWIILAQLILLGWITWLWVSFDESPKPGTVTHHTALNFTVNSFWTGGYDNECRWHNKLMAMVKGERLGLVVSLFGLLLAVVAVAIKVHIATVLHRRPPPVHETWVAEALPAEGG